MLKKKFETQAFEKSNKVTFNGSDTDLIEHQKKEIYELQKKIG